MRGSLKLITSDVSIQNPIGDLQKIVDILAGYSLLAIMELLLYIGSCIREFR